MINDQDLGVIKQFVFSKEYRVLEQIINYMINELRSRPKIANDQWETLKNVVGAESEERGLLRLLQELNNLASKSE